jgi:hypothetical protein
VLRERHITVSAQCLQHRVSLTTLSKMGSTMQLFSTLRGVLRSSGLAQAAATQLSSRGMAVSGVKAFSDRESAFEVRGAQSLLQST